MKEGDVRLFCNTIDNCANALSKYACLMTFNKLPVSYNKMVYFCKILVLQVV